MGFGSLLLASLAALGASSAQEEEPLPEPSWTLGAIEVQTRSIYTPQTAEKNWLAQLVNSTHWTTKESVVRREIWFRPGEPVTERLTAELERNLRRTGLFAEVRATLRPTADPDVRDLLVVTRDRFSLSGGASGSFVGDLASGGFSLAESNLFGTGDRLRFAFFENEDDEFRGSLQYRDRYFLGTWTSFGVEIGRTEEGDFGGARFSRPFRFLDDDFSWDLGGSFAALDRDYFDRDENVAEVPFDDERFDGSTTWRDGTAESFRTAGFAVSYLDRAYGAARGPAAGGIRVPGDTTSLFVGGTLGTTDITEFRKVKGLDTLGFVQDLQLGTTAEITAGGTYRDEAGAESRVQPTFGAILSTSIGLGPTRYATATFDGNARLVAGDAVGWQAGGDLRFFDLTWKPHTIATAISYIEAEETEDLPVQLVLGEGNGLRGYPRREFTGERILRLNVEDRIDLDARLGAFDFGAVVFADIGWIADRGESLGSPLRSAGFGLRIGSESLLGSGVLRVDLSFPLDEFEGESYDPLFSFTLGQVFEFR